MAALLPASLHPSLGAKASVLRRSGRNGHGPGGKPAPISAMKLFDRETEVCVLGGGPAGATIAYCLAHLGHAVYLVERMPFPRAHIGESLAPSILPLLEGLSLRERIEQADFLRPRWAIVRWHDATDHLKSHTGEPGFQVDRSRF